MKSFVKAAAVIASIAVTAQIDATNASLMSSSEDVSSSDQSSDSSAQSSDSSTQSSDLNLTSIIENQFNQSNCRYYSWMPTTDSKLRALVLKHNAVWKDISLSYEKYDNRSKTDKFAQVWSYIASEYHSNDMYHDQLVHQWTDDFSAWIENGLKDFKLAEYQSFTGQPKLENWPLAETIRGGSARFTLDKISHKMLVWESNDETGEWTFEWTGIDYPFKIFEDAISVWTNPEDVSEEWLFVLTVSHQSEFSFGKYDTAGGFTGEEYFPLALPTIDARSSYFEFIPALKIRNNIFFPLNYYIGHEVRKVSVHVFNIANESWTTLPELPEDLETPGYEIRESMVNNHGELQVIVVAHDLRRRYIFIYKMDGEPRWEELM